MANIPSQRAKDIMKKAGEIAGVKDDATPPPAPPATPPAIPPATIPAMVAPPQIPLAPPPAPPVVPPVTPPGTPPSVSDIPDFLLTPEPPAPPPAPPAVAAPVPGEENLPEDVKVNLSGLRKAKDAANAAKEAAEQRLAHVFDAEGKVKPDFIKTLNIASPDVAAVTQERDAALDRLAKLDLQSDPRWQAKYGAQENAARQSILRVAKEYGVDVKQAEDAMKLPLKDRMKFFADNMPDAVPLISSHLTRLDEIRELKEADLTNAKQISEQLKTQTAATREKAIAEARTTIHSQVTREMEDAGVMAFKVVPGNDGWNKGVEGAKRMFMDLLSSRDVIAQSRAFAMAAALPVYQLAVKVADAKIKELSKQLQLHAGAGVKIAAPNGEPPAPASVDPSTMTAEDLAKRSVAEIRARRRVQ